ncbi:hypothetical protein TNCV_1199771 [Trichonephila clavipes]|uniref:Uncharacterized protein n=1 Tax=Trichonephila clavipes TaxID=2585209 RepID=A0A8X6RZS5_TRICX|nr:hypothetical protein TNCV_1199771 [Trichonephila clavipes]
MHRAVCSLVIRSSEDSRPKGLGSMHDATNYPRVHTEYVLVKSVGQKSCGLSHERRGLENISLQFHAEIVEVEIGDVTIYRSFGNFHRTKLYGHLYGAPGQRQAYF